MPEPQAKPKQPQVTLRERTRAAFNAAAETVNRRTEQAVIVGRDAARRARERFDERRFAGGRFGRTIELLQYIWRFIADAFEDLVSYFDTVVEVQLEQDPEYRYEVAGFRHTGVGGHTLLQPQDDAPLRVLLERDSFRGDISVVLQDERGVSVTICSRPFHRVELTVTGLDHDGNEQTVRFSRHLNTREWGSFHDSLGRRVLLTRQRTGAFSLQERPKLTSHGPCQYRRLHLAAKQS